MITAAISGAIVALLSFLGVRLSAAQIAGIVVVVKIFVVATVFAIGYVVTRRKRAAAAATAAAAPTPPPGRDAAG